MKRISLHLLSAAVILAASAFAINAQPTVSQKLDAAAIEREIRAFYDEYAVELRNKKGAAVAARYDSRGSWVMGNGVKNFATAEQTSDKYAKWRGPKSFAWKDLSVDVLTPDVVAVLGTFTWERDNGQVLTFSYTGILIKRDGKWRIRIEDESRGVPAPTPAPAQ